jgi:hypothetical protein
LRRSDALRGWFIYLAALDLSHIDDMAVLLLQYSAALLVCGTALATASDDRRVVKPVVASTTNYGDLIDPGLNRDSCTSTLWSNSVVNPGSILQMPFKS